jgi:GrpB-like predicted nucleotidyltransferase (UPF0157 family)
MASPVIVNYSPKWPSLYEVEKTCLLEVIRPSVVIIEHIGSTAVPGLGAKSVIDMLIGVQTLAYADRLIEPIKSLGYTYVPEYEDKMPYRRYFRKHLKGAPAQYHIHMVETRHEFWDRHLLFRDYLRARLNISREYEKLKRELAPKFTDGNKYAEAKTGFIKEVMRKAKEWNRQSNSSKS